MKHEIVNLEKGSEVFINEDLKELEIEATKPKFIDRGNKATSADFNQAVLNVDETWTDIDLSGIVPAGVKAVVISVYIQTTAALKSFQLRKNGNADIWNRSLMFTQIADLAFGGDAIVPLDSNRVIEYWRDAATWSTIQLTVKGWFK